MRLEDITPLFDRIRNGNIGSRAHNASTSQKEMAKPIQTPMTPPSSESNSRRLLARIKANRKAIVESARVIDPKKSTRFSLDRDDVLGKSKVPLSAVLNAGISHQTRSNASTAKGACPAKVHRHPTVSLSEPPRGAPDDLPIVATR